MGSEKDDRAKPVHKVTFAKPFYMGKYEVTQEQWEAVMGSSPSWCVGVLAAGCRSSARRKNAASDAAA